MRIVIAGAGDVGFHLAQLLASENQDIVLVDINTDLLEYVESNLDVITIEGNVALPSTLEKAEIERASLFIAVTTNFTTNIVSSILAKKMGATQTIARVSNSEYLDSNNKSVFNDLGLDKIISPIKLATEEIKRLLKQCEVTDIFEFENGQVSLAGVILNDESKLISKSIETIKNLNPDCAFNPIAILRGHQTIIPRDYTILKRNDHLYFFTETPKLAGLLESVGKKHIKVKNVMILGGSNLAMHTALALEKLYNITIVVDDKKKCNRLAEILDSALIIHADSGNIEVLKEEGIEQMDVFLALTDNSETNILTCLMADELGVYKTIAHVNNTYYTRISQNIGVDTMINKKIIAANNIFRFIRQGKIEAITSLHGVDAEVIEYEILRDSRLTKKLLKQQNFPDGILIGSILRDNQILVPRGETKLQVGDKVFVFATPKAIHKLDGIFR